MKFLARLAAAALCTLSYSEAINAATLDVDTGPNFAAHLVLSSTQAVGQTFTAGLTGELDRAEMHLYRGSNINSGNVFASLYDSLNGALLGATSFAASTIATGTGTLISMDFAGINVVAGEDYWLNLTTDIARSGSGGIDPLGVGVANSRTDSYAGGTGTFSTFAFTYDHTLRTYVDVSAPPAVPLPAALPVFGAALGSLTFLRLRRSRRT